MSDTAVPQYGTKGFLQVIFIVFIGLLAAFFVGLGVAAFYPSPQAPTYPEALSSPGKVPTDQQAQAEADYRHQSDTYQKEVQHYSRNVSVIALVAALLLLALSLTALAAVHLIGDGIMLGGVFILFYSIGRAMVGSNARLEFVVVSVGLAAVLALAYLRFVRPRS